ncbi:MAG: Gfo/Idh/MocA family oxidoreductase [Clostridia bacterium]|nr:Gfo/Idh/MocA family oxidoreductase [Clostridia bacterium]
MIKVGLIGCGFMGAMHANCYNNIKDATVVAVADVRREKAEELAKLSGAEIYATGRELIEKADVDVIDICLPTYLHAEHALLAMDKVKYVFVEKPVTLTLDEGKALIEKAEKTGAQVQVGQVIRFWDEYVELAKIIKSGKLGKVVNANFRRLSPLPTWGWENWLFDIKKSGGAGQDLHVHDIDYVLSQFGEPKQFFSAKSVLGRENDYVSTLMKYDDFVVSVEGTWALPGTYPFTATFRVVFEKGVVENQGGKFLCYTDGGVEEIKIEKVQLEGGVSGGNVSDLGGYYNELVYFCDKAAKGEKVEQATVQDAVASLDFLLRELAYKA